MKKVVFITTRAIYPMTGGREVVLYNYCKGLKEIFGCEVNLISFIDDKNYDLTPKFINKQYIVQQPGKLEKVSNIIMKSMFSKVWPLQVSIYYSKSTQKHISNIISKINPDILICDMARTAEYVKNINNFKGKKILDMDDLLSKRYYRQAKSLNNSGNILGQYEKKIPAFLRKVFDGKFIGKKLLETEAKLLQKYEMQVCGEFDNIIFVSPIEAAELNEKIKINKAFDVTIGVDYDYYSKNVSNNKNKNLIGFLGNMYVPHNRDAVDYFLKDIFPLVKNEIPDSRFRIIGKCNEEYKFKFKDIKDIEVTGEVDDIRKYVQECEVIVAPLLYGSGIKTKVLESMAMGVPVVTNNIGAEGIKAKNNIDILIKNNIDDFSDAIVKLLKDEEFKQYVILNSKRNILENYIWENTLNNFKKIF
ncbi:MAG: glycosyltransferase family 4 protein [Clostridium sp.]|jgi:glycosyltransferase involved in cell wall biosynthesis|uniref:glycosyltransferase n=1 Tax=Clostridium sp. TaxID=1506 RepID=UPI0025BA5942|nr:glycosyltransferase family 4 protein [Clostridium sp.]MCH3965046.1 glycosyltransferase family 4 protein [Clostridium sp.]MCI1714267.1 glycosyltransferase family 4 protein [Clostridium sp.]MCI1798529.1 glycosyltransferase family 4 protein [Clostridium sp.]MCI1812740.1 glycosyltransferase family 4 protein [Clostridium sp.]MCI1869338.1 glycosyltransferase family 4 protein [Clostridium sp.]